MNNNLNILIFLRISKSASKGLQPIYIRLTLNGQRAEISLGLKCLPSSWNTDTSKVIGNKEEARSINERIEFEKNKIYSAKLKLEKIGEEVSILSLKSYLQNGNSSKSLGIIGVFRDHNQRMQSLVNKEFAPGTITKYNTTLKHLLEFIQYKYSVKEIDIKKINHSFITEFEYFIRMTYKCSNNTTIKYITNFRKVFNTCLDNNWIDKDPFINYKSKVKVVEREFLTATEISLILNKKILNARLDQIRDIFIFSCYTGLAYVDVFNLNPNNIVIGIDGEKWIHTSRQKTKTKSNIPLLSIPIKILSKYSDHPACLNRNKVLPVLSNQKTNAYLKEIADICGIDKDLTFHIARHTFATTITLSNNVPLETVSKMLGHSSIKTTQHYAKILDKKISYDMGLLKAKMTEADSMIKQSNE
ncbi:MAG: site-specific integrase [Saprospiraceae bacterium]